MAGLTRCPCCQQLIGEDIDFSLHQDVQFDTMVRISSSERERLDVKEKSEALLKQRILTLSQIFDEEVRCLEQRIRNLEEENSMIRGTEQISQRKIAFLQRKVEQLETSLQKSTHISHDSLLLNEQLTCELERLRSENWEKDKQIKQYGMVIDLLNQKWRSSEGQFTRLSKRFVTMTKEQ